MGQGWGGTKGAGLRRVRLLDTRIPVRAVSLRAERACARCLERAPASWGGRSCQLITPTSFSSPDRLTTTGERLGATGLPPPANHTVPNCIAHTCVCAHGPRHARTHACRQVQSREAGQNPTDCHLPPLIVTTPGETVLYDTDLF